MRNTSFTLRRRIGIGLLVTLEALCAASPSRAACYSTPRAAMDALIADRPSASASENDGYKVTGIELDKVLARRWAMIARCDHPEWPAVAVLADGVARLGSPRKTERPVEAGVKMAPIVRAGDVVRLWKQEDSVRIELAGVAEESG